MREGWNSYKIEELGRIVTGKTPSTQNPDNFGDKYPFITPRDMSGQKRIGRTERYLSEEGKKAVKNCLLPANSICVSCIGSDMGKVVMTSEYSVTNQQLNSVVCDDSFDPDFVYYSLVNISAELKNAGHHSTAVPILNKTDFSGFEIEAPDLPTQRRIAAILSALDEKVELNRQTNQTLEAIAQALFKEWFVDFNFPGATGEMQESELGPIPKGWKVGKLEQVCELNPRLNLKKGAVAKYVEMKNLSQSTLSIEEPRERGFTSGSKFQNHDTLLARITPCLENGKTGFVDSLNEKEVGWGSTEFIVLRGKETVGPYFIYCLSRLSSFREFAIQSMVGSSGRQRVVESILSDYPLVIPNRETIKIFSKKMKELFNLIKTSSEQAATLSQIRDNLLPILMSGEIDV